MAHRPLESLSFDWTLFPPTYPTHISVYAVSSHPAQCAPSFSRCIASLSLEPCRALNRAARTALAARISLFTSTLSLTIPSPLAPPPNPHPLTPSESLRSLISNVSRRLEIPGPPDPATTLSLLIHIATCRTVHILYGNHIQLTTQSIVNPRQHHPRRPATPILPASSI